MRYRPEIDGLRALAIGVVVAYHAFPGRFPGGFVGVDVFFVISGFLITSILRTQFEEGRFSYAEFYARRVRRLAPALLAVLAVTSVAGLVLLTQDERLTFAKQVFAGTFFVANVLFWHQAGYFDVNSVEKPLLHLWSLGVEEQFYLIWPTLLLLAMAARRFKAALIAAFILVSFGLNLWEVTRDPVAAFFLPQFRLWEMAIGGAIAFAPISLPRLVRDILPVLALAAVLGCLFLFDSRAAYPGWGALVPVAAAACVIASGPEARTNRWLFGNRLAVWIGLISYPLYLWHWPVLAYIHIQGFNLTDGQERGLRLAAIAVSVALAVLTYSAFERRVRTARARTVAAPLAAALVVMVPLAAATSLVKMPLPLAPAADFRALDVTTPGCLEKYGLEDLQPAPSCSEPRPDRPPRILVMGDSHANHWIPGILAGTDDGVLQIWTSCPPIEGQDGFGAEDPPAMQDLCRKTLDRAFAVLRSSTTIDTVLLSVRGTHYMPSGAYGYLSPEPDYFLDHADMTSARNHDLLAAGLTRTFATLRALGKRAIFVFQVPELGFDPRRCAPIRALDLLRPSEPECSVPRRAVTQRQALYRDAIRQALAGAPEVRVFDPLPLFCDERTCRVRDEEGTLYRDDNHLSARGARKLLDLPGFRDAISPSVVRTSHSR